MIEPGTLEYEIERIRIYIARVLLDEINGKEISVDLVRKISADVLEITSQVKDFAGIKGVLEQLVARYPVLEPALVQEIVFEEDQLRQRAATEVTELLKQGKLEEAGALAAQYNRKQ